jgi:hypothetical protein
MKPAEGEGFRYSFQQTGNKRWGNSLQLAEHIHRIEQ